MKHYNIPRFRPRASERRRVWLIIGARNTGKSVLLQDLLYHTYHRYEAAVAMCGTEAAAKDREGQLPEVLIKREGYNYDVADQLMRTASELEQASKCREVLWVMDDCMFDSKVLKTKTQANLHLNGRHRWFTVFNTTQYSMIIPSVIRGNIDYVVATRESILANKRRLYDHYFGMFPSFAEFVRVFDKVTDNYGVMVLDKTKSSQTVESCIRWYRAAADVPRFRLCHTKYFRMAERLRRRAGAKQDSTCLEV